MTPAELVTLFRLDVDDTDAADPLWTDLEVYGYLDEAQKQFARKTDYFSDASTASIVETAVTADDPWITLSPLITRLRSAKLLSSGTKVTPTTFEQMGDAAGFSDDYNTPYKNQHQHSYKWQTRTGTSRYIVTDMEKGKGRLAPIPIVDDTLIMHAYRLPLIDIVLGTATFEITESDYQRGLMHYMEYLAYSKNDVDTFEQDLADRARARAASFHLDVKRDMKRQRFAPTVNTVMYGGL